MSAVPEIKKNPPYDPVADFTPISDIGRYTFFIVVHPSVPVKTLAELIDYARKNPGKLNYATGNTTGIVSTAYFATLARIQLVHVPYKGEPQAITDLVAGRVQMMFCSSSTSVPQIREGKLHAIVTTLGNLPYEAKVYKVGEKYLAARSNEFGFANYEVVPTPHELDPLNQAKSPF
jgi:tripartite-type tricarboxylate transporter receptor subunit TctC